MMPSMSNDTLALRTIIESIDKIVLYSQESNTADELWDIIVNHLPKLKTDINTLIQTDDIQ